MDVNSFSKPKGLVLTSNTFIHEIKGSDTYVYPEKVLAIKLLYGDIIRFPLMKTDKREWYVWNHVMDIQQCVNSIVYGSNKESDGSSSSSEQSS